MTTANSTKAPGRGSVIAFRFLTAAIIIGAAIVGAIGFAGSYDSLKELAEHKGFGKFSYFLPIGVDAGIVALLSLDLWLTRMRIPMPLMRRAAWVLTASTIYFNANAGVPQPTTVNPYPSLWDDPVAVGMHSVLPLSFIAIVEAARHAVLRLAKLAEDDSMDKVRTIRWVLDPLRTFGLWRRMRLWEITSYATALLREKERLVYLYRLRARFGSKRKAPVEVALPLRLADYGELLPAPPLTEREEAEQAAAEAREAKREARARQDREDQEAEERKRREAEREDREARDFAQREAREAGREAAREAHEQEMARLAAESEARVREAREAARIEAEALEREARIEAERRTHDEARRKEKEQVKAHEAERREAVLVTSRTGQEQPREPRGGLADTRPTASRGSRTAPSQGGGPPSREARKAQREDAELHAASFILADRRPTAKDFGGLYGQAETWGGDRLREASKRLDRDAEFRDRAEELRLEQMLTSTATHHTP
ncbi:DUF2637 domain-containing protein [Streptomyces sp. NBC_01433]|uniref:DUF2637 domain-containing protein n=1 Tax=Streptomyces sp. NBC_01433 TaxID=2903864 RepID=UPI002250261E|nr:DUF2637 domain-containing protein [Streptomyces sp. NBC_01433]MCX4681577.1 DUF2637 domain-containing protein [Streptomyces sp. NBC_01433]